MSDLAGLASRVDKDGDSAPRQARDALDGAPKGLAIPEHSLSTTTNYLGEHEIVGVQACDGRILDQDRIGDVERDQDVAADLRAGSLDGGEVAEHAVLELDHIIAPGAHCEIIERILSETGSNDELRNDELR